MDSSIGSHSAGTYYRDALDRVAGILFGSYIAIERDVLTPALYLTGTIIFTWFAK